MGSIRRLFLDYGANKCTRLCRALWQEWMIVVLIVTFKHLSRSLYFKVLAKHGCSHYGFAIGVDSEFVHSIRR